MRHCLSILLLLALSNAALAGSKTPQPLPEQLSPAIATVANNMLFSEADQQVLAEYLNRHGIKDNHHDDNHDKPGKKHKQKRLPPGLQKKLQRGGELPPGWQQKVARGEVLEEDLYLNHSRPLPEDILRRLPSDPEGTSIKQIDDRIVRVMDATRTVLDVFYQVNPQ